LKLYNSLAEIREDLAAGHITMRQVVEGYLDRIDRYQSLNVFVEVYREEALAAAGSIDAGIASGNWKPLTGAVIGVKDVICQKDHGVSAASRILKDFRSVYHATVIQRLLDAGALIIGRLNCDEFAMGSSNENSFYGPVRNALNPERVAGGSSGGSAVAVQAGLCLAALGSDTGGSVRLPASFCGVVGLKPTYGRISRYGLLAYASSFDQIGLLARSVEDCASLLEIMAGPDGYDSTASDEPVPEYTRQLAFGEKARFAVLKEAMENPKLAPEIHDRLKEITGWLEQEGHTVEPVEMPLLPYVVPAYYILTTAEASSNLARYDGVHYGFRHPEAKNMEEVFRMSRSEGFGQEVKRRIMMGTFVLSAGYYDAYYKQGQKVRRLIQDWTFSQFEKYDFVLSPVAASTAFRLGERSGNPIAMYLTDMFTVQANLAGIPAISLPVGSNTSGLPFGLQVMAGPFREDRLLAVSDYLMRHFGQTCTIP